MPTPVRRAFRAFRFLFEREPWVFEVIFGFFTSVFFWLLWTKWQGGPAFGSIVVLSKVQPEDFWQWAGIGGGAVQCIMALLSMRQRRPYLKWPRWIIAGWLAWLWGAMSAAAWLSVPYTPTSSIYAACAVANLYVAFHVLWEEEYRLLRRPGG